MQGEKAGQTKTRTFNRLRGVKALPGLPKWVDILANSPIINGLQEISAQFGRRPSRQPKNASLPHYLSAGILSIPIYGRKTSGTTIEPSAC